MFSLNDGATKLESTFQLKDIHRIIHNNVNNFNLIQFINYEIYLTLLTVNLLVYY